MTELNVFGGGWVRGGPQPEPHGALPPSARKALETAENEMDEVVAEAVRPLRPFLPNDTDYTRISQTEQTIAKLVARQPVLLDAVLRRLVFDDVAARVLISEAAVPQANKHFGLLKPRIEAAQQYASDVREALAVLVSREVLAARGAVTVAEGVGMVRDERVVVVSPLLGQEELLDEVAPGLRERAQRDGIPIEYWQLLIGADGRLTVEQVSGTATEFESAIRYYNTDEDINWMNSLIDERPFAEKVAEAVISGERSREVLKGDLADATMSAAVVLVTYNNHYQVVEKTVRTTDHADAEELGSRTLRDVGARAPEVLRMSDLVDVGARTPEVVGQSELVLLIEYVPGVDSNTITKWSDHPYDLFFHTPDAWRLGLGDTLIRPWDRGEGANWRLEHNVHIVPIDNSNAFGDYPPPIGFTDHFLDQSGDQPRWVAHRIPRTELEAIRGRITASESEYSRLGRLDWYHDVLEIFVKIAAYGVEDTASSSTDPEAALRVLIGLRDDWAFAFSIDGAVDTRTPQEWRQVIKDLRTTSGVDQTWLENLDQLDKLNKMLLHAQLKEVSAEELDDDVWPGLTDVYLEGIAQRLADLEEGARYPDPYDESDEEWQTRFDREIQAATNESEPDNGPPTDIA
ncbi:hypothetical protein [Nocardia sp. NBC_01009]|uniref:hypothetical protein n=1 Tax=Nocardia sp. NBC_01009 TaxID=2975996 RepID=UPI00386E141F|nr:hypothetical protein OHA42_05700 [Nocardia sp. NBC_01009]